MGEHRESYSCRIADRGSTLAARHAGIEHATIATISSVTVDTTSTYGSRGDVSYNSDAITEPNASAAINPMPMPMATTRTPSLTTSCRMLIALAPSATRTPISCVR